jgi:hypothetical protein
MSRIAPAIVCHHHIPHSSRASAQIALRLFRGRLSRADGALLTVYRCGDHWHVGRQGPSKHYTNRSKANR